MPAVSVSAPAKSILFGEHAVVYGRPAIAVPVHQIQARVTVQPMPTFPSGEILLEAEGIGLRTRLANLPEDHPLALAVNGLKALIHADTTPAVGVRITSTIPVASGLGSGAAVSVALVRALANFWGRPLSDEETNALAYQVECRHHGTPSGIDNTVVTYAQPIYFVKGQPFEVLSVAEAITLVIADTGVRSPTAVAVGDVRSLWQQSPEHYEALFDRVGRITQTARPFIEHGPVTGLGQLMTQNHALLQEIGVSSPELDALVEAALRGGALGAKLSGGGRGGNMIALVPPASASAIAGALEAAGAVRVFITTIQPTGSRPHE